VDVSYERLTLSLYPLPPLAIDVNHYAAISRIANVLLTKKEKKKKKKS
jgi:hypothetical protein